MNRASQYWRNFSYYFRFLDQVINRWLPNHSVAQFFRSACSFLVRWAPLRLVVLAALDWLPVFRRLIGHGLNRTDAFSDFLRAFAQFANLGYHERQLLLSRCDALVRRFEFELFPPAAVTLSWDLVLNVARDYRRNGFSD